MATHTVDYALLLIPNVINASVAPFTREVPDEEPTVEWNAASGTIFPEEGYFSWKSGGPNGGATLPTRTSSTKLTLNYEQSAESTWEYSITLETAVGGIQVVVDPEIHNDPPIP